MPTPKKSPKNKRLTRRDLIKRMDKLMSIYTRYGQSFIKNGRLYATCVSCGRSYPVEEMDAGHFVSRTCYPLRWVTHNVNPECRRCNRFSSDHLVGYANYLMKAYKDHVVEVLFYEKTRWLKGEIKPYTILALRKRHNELLREVREIECDVMPTVGKRLIPKTWKMEQL